ncbi:MAG: shikimate kinase [Clostridium sp.]|uniref:shikimate kinase n=1 Tax=Clostridium sp. TaxID=1506 RepID=UPI002FCB7D4B
MIKKIALIGMPGCGKTTIGEKLESETGIGLIDLDKYIVEVSGRSIEDMFNISEDEFRREETKALKMVNMDSVILSTGGGIIKREENRDHLKKNYRTIFIDRPLESILSDVEDESRPLIKGNKERLIGLYNERYDLYKEVCDFHIVNDSTLEEITSKILDIINSN